MRSLEGFEQVKPTPDFRAEFVGKRTNQKLGQNTARKNHLEGRGTLEAEPRTKPAAEPQQEAKKPEVQNASEE